MVKNSSELGRGITQDMPDNKDNEFLFRSVISCMDSYSGFPFEPMSRNVWKDISSQA